MRKIFCSLIGFLVIICFFTVSYSKDIITPADAGKYTGEVRTVCGTVSSTKYSSFSKGKPTFLNLDRPYPNQVFTVVIWGSDRHKFSNPPELYYKGKRICVNGLIGSYRGIPQIVVREPSQIEIK